MTSYHGFELLREQEIPELKTRARLFRHSKTGAELLSLENDDENKVFGITFRTPPGDSTGVAHILEHSVLCGSRKYPVKEPFVELLKGSLHTFLNAFTFPDKTCYPVASQNLRDFYNLIDVYLDAVFYPRITEPIFQQEGWHYELNDTAEPLRYKGVVFNEMKGSFSSPERLLSDYSRRSLFPDTTYGVESGGNPRHIPDLTYEQFKRFHQLFYHPSNARIFFYGDDDPEERLRLIDAYMREFDPIESPSQVPLQPRFHEPRRLTYPFSVAENDANTRKPMLTVNWLLPETSDPQLVLALSILEYILIETPASPLRKALLDSGLGEDLAGFGLDTDLRQICFSTGLKGVAPEHLDAVESLIFRTLEELVRTGIDPLMVDAALNTIEFRLRENNTGSFPRGLALMLRSLVTWLYDGDPLAPLLFEAPLSAIKARLDAGERLFEDLIDAHFLQNPHRTTVVLEPDPQLAQREAAEERARLEALRATLAPDDLQKLVEHTQYLKRLQETPDPPEALARIPRLSRADLDPHVKTVPIEVSHYSGAHVLYHDLFTNGIVYLDVGLDLRLLPHDLLPYVALFGRALLEMGTRHEDYVRLSQRIGRATGGIWPQAFTSAIHGNAANAAWLFLRGKATTARAGELLAILRDVLTSARLDDRERFKQIVLEEKASEEAALIPRGHAVVNRRLRARFNAADWAAEQFGGITYLQFLRQLVHTIDEDWPAVVEQLQQMQHLLLNRHALICNVTVDQQSWQTLLPQLERFLAELPHAPVALATWSCATEAHGEGLTLPAQVNYVGKGADLYQLGYTLHGSAFVINKYLWTSWLWEKIRVQGGAYGGFCSFDHRSGVFTYLSYRDPNLLGTLDVYDQTAEFLRRAELGDAEITQSIIGAIGDMDAYQLPDAKGFSSMIRYLVGESDEWRQRIRDELLATSAADFRAFADVLEQVRQHGQVVVLGAQQAIEAANQARPGLLKVTPVL